jgi:hypothetical protein
VEAWGVEIGGRMKMSEGFSAYANYNYLDAEDPASNHRISNSPARKFATSGMWFGKIVTSPICVVAVTESTVSS